MLIVLYSVVMLTVFKLNAIDLIVESKHIIPNVIMLYAILLSVVALLISFAKVIKMAQLHSA